MISRTMKWLFLLAAGALPHLPLPPFAAELEVDARYVRAGRRALAIWIIEIVLVGVAALICAATCHRVAAAVIAIALVLWIGFGWSKLNGLAAIARAAGYSPDTLDR